jgi:hypothetical protein
LVLALLGHTVAIGKQHSIHERHRWLGWCRVPDGSALLPQARFDLSAAVWATTSILVATAILADAANGFAAGIATGNPHPTGTFHWGGVGPAEHHHRSQRPRDRHRRRPLPTRLGPLWLAIAVMIGRLRRAPASWRARTGTAVA